MKVLFIAHNAYPAGSQLLLLRYLQWLSVSRRDIEIHLLLMKPGPLENAYLDVGFFYLFPSNKSVKNPLKKLYISVKQNKLIGKLVKEKFDVIYSNTILNAPILQRFKVSGTPIITHVHEMRLWFEQLSSRDIQLLKNYTNYFFTASKAVSDTLEDLGIVKSKDTYPVYVFADDQVLLDKERQLSLRKYLNLTPDAILVGSCGSENFRKGKDWFIPIAVGVISRLSHLNIHFVWIGGSFNHEIEFDRCKSFCSDRIHFVDYLPNANLYFHELSLFLMISREDPFPIVNIEAGIHGIPIIGFLNNGGTQELLEGDSELLVPYGNLNIMIERVVSLLNDANAMHEKGEFVKKTIEKRFMTDNVAENITNKIIEITQHFNNVEFV